ncbi:hypothetical protein [Halalkalibacterium halodurans]|uniref:hypothetical protein n=1 Tax=Halalkalibacterium halodurans TaxID=86665 RepID=UPI002AA987C3|nr:hypothetical protein [Halalkalibacterium halodurans]MDY7222109.1 hypothetical protein [Halalkalibacterium halodurans]MDY7243872.1 hypothetical protein [Halalkalibacterium halodurans]
MNQLIDPNNDSQQQGGLLAQASSSREMEEVKGQIFMAKQFPRNVFQAEQRILDNCKRESLAKVAVYQYPRGGQKVEGPSIRLAEVLAQNWGNLAFGVKELEQREGESVAMAYAWDLETNVRQEKTFTVKHSMKAKGSIKKLTDPRDIYEKVANDGARRVRACILGVIPGDIVEKALNQCNETLRGNGDKPLKDRVNSALKAFKEKYRVTQEMIEERFGYNAEAFTEYDYVELIKIFNSLKDGMSKVNDWFSKDNKKTAESGLVKEFNSEKKEDKPSQNTDEKAATSNGTDTETKQ